MAPPEEISGLTRGEVDETAPPLTALHWRTLAAAVECIYPETEGAAGAVELGALDYLRGALSSPWGNGAGFYAAGPAHLPDHPGHGPQHLSSPVEVYRSGLAALDETSRARHGAPFWNLSVQFQDQIIQDFHRDEVELASDVRASEFVDVLVQNVTEAVFGDPRYGGNRDGRGWQWLGYPARAARQ